jgi:RIO kinase 1
LNTSEAHTSPEPRPLDDRFVVDWHAYDDPDDGQRWTTWLSVEPLCRGPEPRPDWVVTSQAAVDTELGVLKTGKEADVHLLERALPPDDPARDGSPGTEVVMAAKRYRDEDSRSFHRSSAYTEGRRVRNTRDARAEWEALVRCHRLGLPVPYPVQVDGTEILMEWITDADGRTAPRLAQTRPAPALLAEYHAQVRETLATLAAHGLVHGDLSPYNILATGERVVVIDLPQVIDLVANPRGPDFLMRDCANVCRWFSSRGLEVDEHALFADLLAQAF